MLSPLDMLRPDLTGFAPDAYPDDRHGWGSDAPVFARLIAETRPRLLIEVGSWKGASAIHLADCAVALGLNTRVLCVDTWLGALEMWTDPADPTRYGSLKRRWGYPTVYEQFLANIVRAGHAQRIIPFPQTSLIAARWLTHQQIRADLIYIDASHDAQDVAADVAAYLPLLAPGGVLFGDDWDCWASVRAGVGLAAGVRTIEVIDGRYWRIGR